MCIQRCTLHMCEIIRAGPATRVYSATKRWRVKAKQCVCWRVLYAAITSKGNVDSNCRRDRY